MKYFIIPVTLLLLLLLAPFGCATVKEVGKRFDDICIAGRLEAEAAQWLNENTGSWKQHGDYRSPLRAGDRLFNGDCSEVSKSLLKGELEEAGELLESL